MRPIYEWPGWAVACVAWAALPWLGVLLAWLLWGRP